MAEVDEKEVVKTADRLAALETPTETPKEEKEPDQPKTETAEKPVETPELEVEESLPTDTKEAGKAFAEMRRRNKELEEKIKALEITPELVAEPSGLENYKPLEIGVPSIPTGIENTSFFNAETGEFDAIGYQNYVVTEARKEAQRAVEEQRQIAEAEAAYPELKNSNTAFYKATKGILLSSMVEGKRVTAKEAADLAASLSKKEKEQIATAGAEQAIAEIAAKEAVALEAGGNSGRAASAESAAEVEALRDASRGSSRESTEARAERLKRLGI